MTSDSEIYRHALEIRLLLAQEIIQVCEEQWRVANREYKITSPQHQDYYEGKMDGIEGIADMVCILTGLTYEGFSATM